MAAPYICPFCPCVCVCACVLYLHVCVACASVYGTCITSSLPPPPFSLSSGRIAVTGSNGTVVSGTTVILMCTQEVVDSTAVQYMWTREGGRPLPEEFVVTNGEPSDSVCVCVCVCVCAQ